MDEYKIDIIVKNCIANYCNIMHHMNVRHRANKKLLQKNRLLQPNHKDVSVTICKTKEKKDMKTKRYERYNRQ